MTRCISEGATHVGRVRAGNEDAFLRDDSLAFYVVADGVGGMNKGEVASRETVEQLQMWIRSSAPRIASLLTSQPHGEVQAIRQQLESAVQSACYMVYGMAQQDPTKKGMSTTCSALLIRGDTAYAAHVGDSRVYRLRGEEVMQITEDHTLINYKIKMKMLTPAQAEKASGKNVITRAVGHKDHVQVDTASIDARAGDRFLMCTDGLHGYLKGSAELIDLAAEGSLKASTAAAISLANQRGGKDNTTVVLIEVASI